MAQSFWTGSAGGRNIRSGKSLFSGKRSFFRKRVDGQRKFPERSVHRASGLHSGRRDGEKLGISTEKAVRLIPYHSIGRAHGLLRAVTVSELYLRKDGQEKKIADVTVAVGPGRLSRSGGYQMILHPALLEEKKGADHDIKSSDAGKSAV